MKVLLNKRKGIFGNIVLIKIDSALESNMTIVRVHNVAVVDWRIFP